MNTNEPILVVYPDGTQKVEPEVWCDLCGWGDTIGNDGGQPDDPAHFCHRHKAREVLSWWRGETRGYFDVDPQESLDL